MFFFVFVCYYEPVQLLDKQVFTNYLITYLSKGLLHEIKMHSSIMSIVGICTSKILVSTTSIYKNNTTL